jgi:hypothetical protein
MNLILKFLASKITGTLGTKLGIALARVIVRRTKTKVDDEIMVELGLMDKSELAQ